MKFSVKKIIFIFFLILIISLPAQDHRRSKGGRMPGITAPVSLETHIVPTDSIFTCFISYKVPLGNLMFIKGNGNFSSAITLKLDIYKSDKLVDRAIKESSIVVDDYETTKNNNLFLQDIISIKLPKAAYTFNPVASFENTDFEIKLKPLEVIVDSVQSSAPFAVSQEKKSMGNKAFYQLINTSNTIPYSAMECDLLIPVYDNAIQYVEFEVIQEGISKVKKKITEYESLNLGFEFYDNSIILINDDKYPKTKLFIFPSVNKKLIEGEIKLKVAFSDEVKEYNSFVSWYNKPRSLQNPEFAIEMLEIIEKDKDADSLLSFPDEEYYKVLFDYWIKFDKDTSTAFNEVFELFYARVDEANIKFKSLNGDSGALSDRGKIYVRYGEPDFIEREYNEQYNIIEIWDYKSLNKKIIFSDQTGTGNFIRVK